MRYVRVCECECECVWLYEFVCFCLSLPLSASYIFIFSISSLLYLFILLARFKNILLRFTYCNKCFYFTKRRKKCYAFQLCAYTLTLCHASAEDTLLNYYYVMQTSTRERERDIECVLKKLIKRMNCRVQYTPHGRYENNR